MLRRTSFCLILALAACSPQPSSDRARSGNDDQTAAPVSNVVTAMSDADRARFDVDDVRLGMTFSDVEKAWRQKHPGYKLEKKSEWVEGLGSYVVSVRYADASGADALAAAFSSPASGNRAYFLSHT